VVWLPPLGVPSHTMVESQKSKRPRERERDGDEKSRGRRLVKMLRELAVFLKMIGLDQWTSCICSGKSSEVHLQSDTLTVCLVRVPAYIRDIRVSVCISMQSSLGWKREGGL
jgi:hypothetical protein